MKKIMITIIMTLLACIICYASEVRIEDVRVDKKIRNAWAVKGKVKNRESHSIKGYVKIKFLNWRGDVMKSVTTTVNGGDLIKPQQAAPFEYYAEPEEFEGATKFDVIFIDWDYKY